MVQTAGFRLSLILLVLLLLECSWATDCPSESDCPWAANCPWAASRDAPSLCYNFTITPNGQSWCEVQGHVNGNTFLHYSCSSQNVKPIGLVALKVNDTDIWKRQTQILKYLVEELKKILLDIKSEIIINTGSPSLQGRMMCQPEASGCSSPSWELRLDGKGFLHSDTKNRTYRVDDSGGEQMNKMWKNGNELTMLLRSFLVGQYREWNGTFFIKNEEPQTRAAPSMVPTQNPLKATTPSKATTSSKATTTAHMNCILSVFIYCLIIIGTLMVVDS